MRNEYVSVKMAPDLGPRYCHLPPGCRVRRSRFAFNAYVCRRAWQGPRAGLRENVIYVATWNLTCINIYIYIQAHTISDFSCHA
jgi:hypothetical protein